MSMYQMMAHKESNFFIVEYAFAWTCADPSTEHAAFW